MYNCFGLIRHEHHGSYINANSLFTLYVIRGDAMCDDTSMVTWCAHTILWWWNISLSSHVRTHPLNYCWHIGQARYCSDINVNSLFTLYFMWGNALSDCASVLFMMCLCGVQMVKIFYQGCTRVIIPSTSGARAAALIQVQIVYLNYISCGGVQHMVVQRCISSWGAHVNCEWWKYFTKCTPA